MCIRDRRCTYEYGDFMENFLQGIEVDRSAYPEGVEVLCPIQTWSDDFSLSLIHIWTKCPEVVATPPEK